MDATLLCSAERQRLDERPALDNLKLRGASVNMQHARRSSWSYSAATAFELFFGQELSDIIQNRAQDV